MLWKLEYSDYRIKPEIADGKKDAFDKAFRTLLSYPYLSVDFYKFKGDEKIYVSTHELKKIGTYETNEEWNENWKLVEKKRR